MKITFSEIEYATPEYSESIVLRDLVLRKPLGISFTEEQLSEEWDQIHIAGFDESERVVAILVMKPISKFIVKMRQVAIHPSLHKKGIGTDMVQFTETLMKFKKYRIIELNARDVAVPFYTRLNYDKVGDMFIEVNIPHYKMTKSL